MTWLTVILLVALAFTALPVIIEMRRKPVDDDMRRSAPGSFADLPQGRTHYQWTGPAAGPVAVCVHGLTTPGYVWDRIAADLAAGGYRVLVYDHIGRGLSDRAGALQDRSFFVGHLEALLAHEAIDKPFVLLGYSMGGAVATAFAADNPQRVDALILIAPAGLGRPTAGVKGVMLNTPLLGDWLMLTTYPKQLREGIEAERRLGHGAPDVNDRQLAEIDKRGYIPAVLSSLRGLIGDVQEEDHRRVGAAGVPVLGIWARDDNVIPVTALDVLGGWNPEARQHVVDGAGHGLPYTHSAEVTAQLRGFLAERG